MTKKFWMMAIVIGACLSAGLQTGCPDEGDCASDPSLCDPDSDTDTDAGADSDSDTTEDDGDTSEETACPSCPNVAGDWTLTYHSDTTGAEWTTNLHLDQNGDAVTGYDEDCEYSGNVTEGSELSLSGDCPPMIWVVTANLTTPSHLEGIWYTEGGTGRGPWRADRQ